MMNGTEISNDRAYPYRYRKEVQMVGLADKLSNMRDIEQRLSRIRRRIVEPFSG